MFLYKDMGFNTSRLVFVAIMLFGVIPIIYPQKECSEKPVFVGLNVYCGSFQVHTPKLSAFRVVKPRGVEFELSRWVLTERAWQSFGIYPKLGIGVNYVDFGHSGLGYSVNGVAYVEPFIKAMGRLKFSGKLGTGFAYLSNPYHPETNPLNQTNSTKLAFPLVGGVSGYYFFDDRWSLKTTVSFRHISNGGTKKPNLGINYPVVGIGIEYTSDTYVIPESPKLNAYEKNKRTELLVGYSSKKDTLRKDDQHVFAAYYNRSFRGGRINAFTLSGMVEYKLGYGQRDVADELSLAPLLGNEFLIGDLRFGQQVGLYLLKGIKAPNDIFQNYYLRYLIQKKMSAGVVLKVHGRVADYLAFQVGVVL